MTIWTRLAGLTALAGCTLLAACGGGDNSSAATVRLLNASVGYPTLDLYIDDGLSASAVTYGSASAYIEVDASDSVSTMLSANGSTTALASNSRSFTEDTDYTLIAYGWQGAIKTAVLTDSVDDVTSGKNAFAVMNLASDAGSVDVYLTGSAESLDSATALSSSLAGGATSVRAEVSAGTYRLRVTAAGDRTDLRLDVQGLVLSSTQVATLVLTSGSGGVLVNGVLAVQSGTVTTLSNTQARARVVSSVTGNALVSATVGTVNLASATTSPSIGSYALINGSSAAPVSISVNGTAMAVASQALPAGGDYTLLVWGPASAPQLTVVTEDNRLPATTGYAGMRLVNGLNGNTAGLSLSADFSALASNLALGQFSSFATVAASTSMRIEVATPLSSTALYSQTSATILSKGLYTVYLLGDTSNPVAVLRKER